MARETRSAPHSGLYAELAEREERAMALGGTVINPITGTSYDATAARLAAFRAGAPVSLPAASVPQSARAGVACQWWTRAVVHPSGAVEFLDDAEAWLAEQGL